MRYLLGIDGGGTSCRAALADLDGNVLGRGRSGGANIVTNLQDSATHIIESVERAFDDAGLARSEMNATCALLGLAGANVGDYGDRLRGMLPFEQSVVESDAVVALYGALGPHDGVVAILGTGSVFAARRGSYVRMIGGWGFILGDHGSGARLGRSLLQYALLVFDGIKDGSELTSKAMSMFDNDPRAIVEYAKTARPADFAALAPLVFEQARQGDQVGQTLVAHAVKHVEEALAAILPEGGARLCLLGGLAPFYAPLLAERHGDLLHEPLGDGLAGAVMLAAHHFAHGGARKHG